MTWSQKLLYVLLHILFVRNKSLRPAHIQKQEIKLYLLKGGNIKKQGSILKPPLSSFAQNAGPLPKTTP